MGWVIAAETWQSVITTLAILAFLAFVIWVGER